MAEIKGGKSQIDATAELTAIVVAVGLVAVFLLTQAYPAIGYRVDSGTGDPTWYQRGTIFHGEYELWYTPAGGNGGMCVPGPCWWFGQLWYDPPHAGEYMIAWGSTWAGLLRAQTPYNPDGAFTADQRAFLDHVAASYPWVTGE